MRRRILQVTAGVALGLILALVWALREGPGAGPEPVDEALLPAPFPAPPLDLVDPSGVRVRLADLRGSVVAIFFGYTHCPDVCPLTLATLGRLQEQDRDPPLEVVFVSVDPERDTPDRLRTFTTGLPGRIRGWTADGDEVRRQADGFGVRVHRREDAGPDYLVDHTARTFIVDPEGAVVATLPPMVSPERARAVVDAVYRRHVP